jgi:hypothetical protein
MLTEQKTKSDWLRHILIIQTVVLVVGIYLIATTVVISRDSLGFIDFAKNMRQDAVSAMLKNYQHPGYPFMICLMEGFFRFVDLDPFWSWIYSAQIAALLCRMGSLIILYFIGKKFVGEKLSFWAVLILACMPSGAEKGSDALSDWPHLLALTAGMLILVKACQTGRPWLFGSAGFLAGIGYLIRPECVQLVVYAGLWLLVKFFRSKTAKEKSLTFVAAVLLIVGVAIPAAPYMKLKGAVFPKKSLDFSVSQEVSVRQVPASTDCQAAIAPKALLTAVLRLCVRIFESLTYFFAVFLPIGIWMRFRNSQPEYSGKFLISVFIMLNVAAMLWLFCRHGYMSRRHVLPLVALTVFYVPVGIEAVSYWLGEMFRKNNQPAVVPNVWFLILVFAGLCAAMPKLLMPIGSDKVGYRQVAAWIEANTAVNDVVMVPDTRISFYAKRKGVSSGERGLDVKYMVKSSDADDEYDKIGQKLFVTDKGKGNKTKLTVYRLAM